jgi:hypothetical protein
MLGCCLALFVATAVADDSSDGDHDDQRNLQTATPIPSTWS